MRRTTMDMMMTAKMASVAIPISMISGSGGGQKRERHVAAVFHEAVSKDSLHDVALRDDAGEAHKEVSEANSERRRCDLGRGQADLRHDGKANRNLDGDDADGPRGLKAGLERCVARLAHLLVCAVEDGGPGRPW